MPSLLDQAGRGGRHQQRRLQVAAQDRLAERLGVQVAAREVAQRPGVGVVADRQAVPGEGRGSSSAGISLAIRRASSFSARVASAPTRWRSVRAGRSGTVPVA